MSDFFDELMKSVDSLSDEQVAKLLSKLEVKQSGIEKVQEQPKEDDIVKEEDIPMACSNCGSIAIKKHGKKSGRQRYYCKDCHKTFVSTTGSVMQHSRLSPAQMKAIIQGLVQNLTLEKIADMADCSTTTVWFNKQKICSLLLQHYGYTDRFVDIAECDEKYTVISFKGKRDPEFFVNTLNRLPRHNRTYQEKLEYLKAHGLLDRLQQDPVRLEMLLSSSNSYKQGISNEQVAILTCKDRSGNLLIKPACVGRLERGDVTKLLEGKFESDAILVTDSHNAYPSFARENKIYHEQIPSGEHKKGAYNLARINALHSSMENELFAIAPRRGATKYLDLSLIFFWWLEKHKELSMAGKVSKLYELITGNSGVEGVDYKAITNRPLDLNTKGLIPEKV